MQLNIGVIKGDGIGPEIVTEAMKVLDKVAEVYGHSCKYTQLLLGGGSIDVHGVPLTEETVEQAKQCDAVLMGSIGGDAKTSPWYQLEPSKQMCIRDSTGEDAGFVSFLSGGSEFSLPRFSAVQKGLYVFFCKGKTCRTCLLYTSHFLQASLSPFHIPYDR